MRVADYIADFIYQKGVRHIFLVTGGGAMFLDDGVAAHPHLKGICNHHEQASAMAAVSYAKYAGFGAALLTTGCGGTNAMTGLLGAWQDNVPTMFISGQSKRKETVRNSGLALRQFGVQEADIIAIVKPLTKYAEMINDPTQIRYHLEKAYAISKSGRPGPVWLDIPMDVQSAEIDPKKLQGFDQTDLPQNPPISPEDLKMIASYLNNATRPIIIAGQGVRLSGAIPAFQSLIQKYNIPYVASRLGIDLLPSDEPLFIGRIGNKGDRAGNFAIQNADLVLVLGSRLSVSSTGHEYQNFAREAKVIVVDIDPIEHQKNTIKIDHLIQADIGQFLKELEIQSSLNPKPKIWPQKCLDWKTRWPVCLPQYATETDGINYYYFVDQLSRKMPDNAIIVSDAGSAFYVVSQAVQLKPGQRYITSGAQAEMGYTLPACIGLSFAAPGKPIIGVTGDGSFQMNIQELQTMIHHRLPIKLFVVNNNGYLSIRASQTKFFSGRFIGTDNQSGLSFPDINRIATAYQIPYKKIATSESLPADLSAILSQDGPMIIEVPSPMNQEIIPTVSSYKTPDGKLVSRPLEDMYPFLARDEFRSEMIVKPVEE